MTAYEIIRNAIPGASDELCEHIIWGRTPWPCRGIEERELYKAASGWRRACANKLRLCDLCHRPATKDKWTCERCTAAINAAREDRQCIPS